MSMLRNAYLRITGQTLPYGDEITTDIELAAALDSKADLTLLDAKANRIELSQIEYSSLLNPPTLFDGEYSSLNNPPPLFSGNYEDLGNKPILFDGDYDSLANRPALFSGSYLDLTNVPVMYSYFAIWAEENGDLSSGQFEWSYGANNTDLAAGRTGITIPIDCELIAISIAHEGLADTEVDLYLNGADSGHSVVTVNTRSGMNLLTTTEPISAGDVVNFRTLQGDNSSNGSVISAWFRKAI